MSSVELKIDGIEIPLTDRTRFLLRKAAIKSKEKLNTYLCVSSVAEVLVEDKVFKEFLPESK